jgi:phenylalanine-4-hydroxylase
MPNRDTTIDQGWTAYTADDHRRWDRLYERCWALLQTRACDAFLDAATRLKLSQKGIPDFRDLSGRLTALTGWQVVAVAGLVSDSEFFDHLANRRFPAAAFIRSEAGMDYLEEPDIFHDVFGHVPLLADPVYADFMQAYGKGGQRALELNQLRHLARLYWYTIEFGLVQSPQGLRIFGAGIMSSTAETTFALADPSPHRIAFNLERTMRTKYSIDDFQKTYFVIESFAALRRLCLEDFSSLYQRLAVAEDIEPGALVGSDQLVSRGTLAYFGDKGSAVPDTQS